MAVSRVVLTSLWCLTLLLALNRCGISTYPGQPGLVTDSYAKIDLEYLEEPGLFVYEVVYDNTGATPNVGAIVTKLYPGAQTFTSNVRTNADGTLFRSKQAYRGAEVQMIALPAVGQIHFSPDHKIEFMLEYTNSLDEVDNKNISEQGLFKPVVRMTKKAHSLLRTKFDLLRAGKFNSRGGLSYEVVEVDFGTAKYKPAASVVFETNLAQNGVRSTLSSASKKDFAKFLETNFPTGFKGTAKVTLKDVAQPLVFNLGISTPKTMAEKGIQVSFDATEKMAQDVLQQFKKNQ